MLRRALAVIAAGLLACGPGDPPAPEPVVPDGSGGGGDAGGGAPDAGAPAGSGTEPGGGTTGGGTGGGGTDPGGGTGGGGSAGGGGETEAGRTAWVELIGGAGAEEVRDVAALSDGSAVALAVVLGDGERIRRARLVNVDAASGAQRWERAFDLGSARMRVVAGGALAGAEGHFFLAVECAPSCDLGAQVSGPALARFSAGGETEWVTPLTSSIASNVVADGAGNAAVATRDGGAVVVRKHGSDGALRWEARLDGAPARVALAAGSDGSVVVGGGGSVTKLDASGDAEWTRDIAAGVEIAALAALATGDVAVAGSAAGGVQGTDVGPGAFVAALDRDGRPRWARTLGTTDEVLLAAGGGRLAAVTSPGGCSATVAAIDPGGTPRWSRLAAVAGCEGTELSIRGVAATSSGAVIVGGAVRGEVDLGTGVARAEGVDGWAAAFGP